MDELTILSHPARVRSIAEPDALLARLNERTGLPSDGLYLWRAEISNSLLDSHFTRMSESTLRNYAADAQAGVAFLKGHDWRALPIGYSLDAAYEDGDGKKRVVADFYTVRGLSETDDLIRRMEAHILRDVSVGFHGGEMTCDLCSRGFWDCPHIPGLRYEIKEGDTIRTELATFTIEDARLSEVSGVFDGSTPGAMILKAQERAAELTDVQRRILEQTYRVILPVNKRAFAGVDITNGQAPRKVDRMNDEQFKRLTEILVNAKVVPSDQRETLDEDGALDAAGKLAKRVADLEPQAADGRQYRADLIAEALAEGVRAQGQDFDKPTYEGMLTNAPVATIKRMRDDWKRIGDERLAGGRKSVDDDQTPQDKPAERVSYVPASAYQG